MCLIFYYYKWRSIALGALSAPCALLSEGQADSKMEGEVATEVGM